jgi:hypothetical protein
MIPIPHAFDSLSFAGSVSSSWATGRALRRYARACSVRFGMLSHQGVAVLVGALLKG